MVWEPVGNPVAKGQFDSPVYHRYRAPITLDFDFEALAKVLLDNLASAVRELVGEGLNA